MKPSSWVDNLDVGGMFLVAATPDVQRHCVSPHMKYLLYTALLYDREGKWLKNLQLSTEFFHLGAGDPSGPLLHNVRYMEILVLTLIYLVNYRMRQV
jgi:hypothetical protein